jgi:hypothetical protein
MYFFFNSFVTVRYWFVSIQYRFVSIQYRFVSIQHQFVSILCCTTLLANCTAHIFQYIVQVCQYTVPIFSMLFQCLGVPFWQCTVPVHCTSNWTSLLRAPAFILFIWIHVMSTSQNVLLPYDSTVTHLKE